MIPQIIHYCWFGNSPIPEKNKKYIESWKKFFPDYEIKEWNESNWNFNCCDYVREAYEAKQWAFVSDYARFDILYKYGGVYFDTDVEVIKSMDDILDKGAFMGLECGSIESLADKSLSNMPGVIRDRNISDAGGQVNPGLGLAVAPGLGLYKEILEEYQKRHFIKEDGSQEFLTVVHFVTNILLKKGITIKDGLGMCGGIYIYPVDYFNPKSYQTGELRITNNTRSIHHYDASWHTKLDSIVIQIERCKKSKRSLEYIIRRFVSAPFRVANKIEKYGFRTTILLILKKITKK